MHFRCGTMFAWVRRPKQAETQASEPVVAAPKKKRKQKKAARKAQVAPPLIPTEAPAPV